MKKILIFMLIASAITKMPAQNIEINEANFPDAAFRAYLLSRSEGADGVFTPAEIEAIKGMGLEAEEYEVESLEGIRFFTNLYVLFCHSNNLTTLDVSGLTNLGQLYCHNNNLTTLDVSGCTSLYRIDCYGNNLTELDVSGLTNLAHLYCYSNNLTELDISSCTALKYLYIYENPLSTSFNIDAHPALIELKMYDCPNVEEINVTNCQELTTFRVGTGGNSTYNLKRLNLSGCSKLSSSGTVGYLRLNAERSETGNYENAYCKIEEVDLTGCTSLRNFSCYSSYLKKLKFNGCSALQTINISQGCLTENDIDLTGCTRITQFIAHRQNFTDLTPLYDKFSTSLTQLQMNGGKYNRNRYPGAGTEYWTLTNNLREIDMSRIPSSLEILMVRHNLLQQLTIHDKPNIRQIQVNNNLLWCADLSGLQSLQATEKKANSTQKGDLVKSYLKVSSQRPSADVTVVKGEAFDGSEDKVRLYVPDNVYDDFNNSLLDLSSMTFLGKKLPESAFVDDGTKKYFELASVAGGVKADLDLYRKHNGFTYIYDTQAMSDPERVANNSNNKLSWDGDAYTVDELIANFEDVRKMDVNIVLFPYVMYVNPATMSGTGVDYYSGTLWLDYNSIVPDGTEVYIATAIKPAVDSGNSQAHHQLQMEKIGGPGDVIPAGTAMYVRAKTQAGLYAFHKAYDIEYLGWDGEGAQSLETDTIVVGQKYSAERQDALQRQIEKIGNRNILEGSGTDQTFGLRKVLVLGIENQKGTKMIGFWPYNRNTVPAHRAFIREETYERFMGENSVSSETKGMAFYFKDEEIGEVTEMHIPAATQTSGEDRWYTLSGVQLKRKPSQKGIYFHNGKKEVVK